MTIHWENLAGFIEDAVLMVEVTTELYEIDRNRFSCVGRRPPSTGCLADRQAASATSCRRGRPVPARAHPRPARPPAHVVAGRSERRHPKLLSVIEFMDSLEDSCRAPHPLGEQSSV